MLVALGGEEGCRETERLMASGVPAIFQATFAVDGFIAKCDVLVPGAVAGTWDIYEIKGTNSKKEGNEDRDHISDLTFQAIVLERAGVKVGRTFIVHLDKEYVRQGALDVEAMFVKDDSTEQVAAKRAEIEADMAAAHEYLKQRGRSRTADASATTTAGAVTARRSRTRIRKFPSTPSMTSCASG